MLLGLVLAMVLVAGLLVLVIAVDARRRIAYIREHVLPEIDSMNVRWFGEHWLGIVDRTIKELVVVAYMLLAALALYAVYTDPHP